MAQETTLTAIPWIMVICSVLVIALDAIIRHKLRVIYFGDADWGFSDAALPKLRALFETSALPVDGADDRNPGAGRRCRRATPQPGSRR